MTPQPSREDLGKMAYEVDMVNEDGMPLWDELPPSTQQSYINTSKALYDLGRKDAEAAKKDVARQVEERTKELRVELAARDASDFLPAKEIKSHG